MIFAIDVGNTSIVVGCIDGTKTYFSTRLVTDYQKSATEYALLFKNILELHNLKPGDIEGSAFSSVVPPIDRILRSALSALFGNVPLEINSRTNHGLVIDIDSPTQLGNDLLVGAIAGLDKFKPPLIIFDLGTTTTISVIDKDKVFCGCAFIPGIKISLNALAEKTAQLPKIDLTAPEHVIGKNTVDAMQSGMLYGTASMMDGMIDRIEEELGEKTTVLATGGLASFVIPHCKHQIHLDDDLLLKGLWVLYNKNKD